VRILPHVLCALVGAASAGAEGLVNPQDMPGPLKEVRFDQRLGEKLPLDAVFVDERGETVTLGRYFGRRPAILAFVYFECPMLCTLTLNGLAKSLDVVDLEIGREIDVVVVSIDPGEGPEEARAVKADTLLRYGRPESAPGWHFLTGTEDAVARLTAAAGFHYNYLPEDDEYAHTTGIVIVDPKGTISQYYLGIEYPPRDVRLALVEASAGGVGTAVDQLLLYCFRFDPEQGKYTAATMRILRLAAGAFALGLFAFVGIAWHRERARRPSSITVPSAEPPGR
jgi:protein SCO1/2